MPTLNFVNENGTVEKVDVSDETMELAYRNACDILSTSTNGQEIIEQIEDITTNDHMRSLIADAVCYLIQEQVKKQMFMQMLKQLFEQ